MCITAVYQRMFSHCLALYAICTTTTEEMTARRRSLVAPRPRRDGNTQRVKGCGACPDAVHHITRRSPSFHVISSLVMTGTMPGSPNATMPAKRLLICPAFLNETQNGQVTMRHIPEAETVYGPLRDAIRGLSLDTDVVLHPPGPLTISGYMS